MSASSEPEKNLEFEECKQHSAAMKRVQSPISAEHTQELVSDEQKQHHDCDESKHDAALDDSRSKENVALNEHTPPRSTPSILDISRSCLAELD
ncbi:hypothetical protein ABMA28_012292, partial [Loxostege sticticalis]